MKKPIKLTIEGLRLIFGFIILINLLPSCYQYPEIDESIYQNYMRVMGPEGGTIYFYRNYENDSIEDLAVKMEFPENALDSFIVFNMYEYGSDLLDVDLNNMGKIALSDFLYFVPFYESTGYNEHASDDIAEHNSISFNVPVTITYYLSGFEIEEGAELYNIIIPAENEWGTGAENNIWINYNEQGYPDGYDEQDLMYIITGRWTEELDWGYDTLTIDNWEEFNEGEYVYSVSDSTVTFFIDNTDFLFVLATDIEE